MEKGQKRCELSSLLAVPGGPRTPVQKRRIEALCRGSRRSAEASLPAREEEEEEEEADQEDSVARGWVSVQLLLMMSLRFLSSLRHVEFWSVLRAPCSGSLLFGVLASPEKYSFLLVSLFGRLVGQRIQSMRQL